MRDSMIGSYLPEKRGPIKKKIIIFSAVYTTLQYLTVPLFAIRTLIWLAIDFAWPAIPVIIEAILLKIKFRKNNPFFDSILLYFTVFYTSCAIIKKMLSITHFII